MHMELVEPRSRGCVVISVVCLQKSHKKVKFAAVEDGDQSTQTGPADTDGTDTNKHSKLDKLSSANSFNKK